MGRLHGALALAARDSRPTLPGRLERGGRKCQDGAGDVQAVSSTEDMRVPVPCEHLATRPAARRCSSPARPGRHAQSSMAAGCGTSASLIMNVARLRTPQTCLRCASSRRTAPGCPSSVLQREHADSWRRSCAPRSTKPFVRYKRRLDPIDLFNPGRSSIPQNGRRFTCSGSAADRTRPYRTIAFTPVLDWSAWRCAERPGDGQTSPPARAAIRLADWPRASRCATTTAIAASSMRARCARAFTPRATSSTSRVAAPTPSDSLYPGSSGRTLSRARQRTMAMDLCVSCKGCRRECPTGVDMARMKLEFLAITKRGTVTL